MKKTLPRKLLVAFCLATAMAPLNGAMAAIIPVGVISNERADIKVTGTVVDKAGIPVPGVSVQVKNSTNGTSTDADGRFSLTVSENAILVFQSVGFKSTEVSISGKTSLKITLQEDAKILDEVVVVGYGTQRKKDLTGAVTSISAKEFNKGPIVSPEQLIAGKVGGVQVTSNGGEPGAGSRIRIRGAASLSASNDPLIVVDGVPLDNKGVDGSASSLSFINPNEIETFSILKDASAAAIYGSRASNGVILITTKKGNKGDKFKVGFSSIESFAQKTGTVDVLSPDQLRKAVMEHGSATQQALLGSANTNWQNQIYQDAISHDNNLSFSGGIKNLPYRFSVGYLGQQGILKTSEIKRTSASLNLNPRLFQDHLKIDLNLKGTMNKSQFADNGAISAAVAFDPTKPVYDPGNPFGGFYEDLLAGNLNTLAPRNPLGTLMQKEDIADVKRTISNLQLDYKFHFLPELRANANLGYDYSETEGNKFQTLTFATANNIKGRSEKYAQIKNNKLFEFYLNYIKEVKSINSRFDLTGGYSYQDWIRENPKYASFYGNGTEIANSKGNPFKTQNTLLSFYGRLNYAFMDRYLVTASIRRDGSSRFAPDVRWGLFPSVALAWKISDEAFLKNSNVLSDLKLRVGYGETGQQDITDNDYSYLPIYTLSDGGAAYQFGGTSYNTYRANGYDPKIKWEQTTTSNIALDFGFLDGRISGSLDFYSKNTTDLLNKVPVPALQFLSNELVRNVGSLENKGIELVVNANPVRTKNFNWDLGFNVSHNQSKITKLNSVEDPKYIGVPVGGISGGVDNKIQIHTVGYAPFSFFVHKQVYDNAGKPIEGVYADLNDDGVVDANDRYHYKSPEPTVSLGFNSQFAYKQWNLGFALRANLGNYMYNNVNSNSPYKAFSFSNYLTNVSSDVLNSNFTDYQLTSDYYVENASFLRMDNINLGYTFKNILNNKVNMRLTANAQNVFVVTKYKGLDPEFSGGSAGIDNNFYPRARVFSMGVNLDF